MRKRKCEALEGFSLHGWSYLSEALILDQYCKTSFPIPCSCTLTNQVILLGGCLPSSQQGPWDQCNDLHSARVCMGSPLSIEFGSASSAATIQDFHLSSHGLHPMVGVELRSSVVSHWTASVRAGSPASSLRSFSPQPCTTLSRCNLK